MIVYVPIIIIVDKLYFERLSNFLTLTSSGFSTRNRFDTEASSPSLTPFIFLLRDIIDKRTQSTVGCYADLETKQNLDPNFSYL
jgi:hypothetical protein